MLRPPEGAAARTSFVAERDKIQHPTRSAPLGYFSRLDVNHVARRGRAWRAWRVTTAHTRPSHVGPPEQPSDNNHHKAGQRHDRGHEQAADENGESNQASKESSDEAHPLKTIEEPESCNDLRREGASGA